MTSAVVDPNVSLVVAPKSQVRTSNTHPPKCRHTASCHTVSQGVSNARCVGYGVDTFEFGFFPTLTLGDDKHFWEQLDDLKARAQRGLKPSLHFGGVDYEVLPHGGGSVYGWKIASAHFGIAIGRQAPDSTPTLAFRPECAFLWEVGPEAAWNAAQDIAHAVDVNGERPRGHLSRVDLCADFQGIDFEAAMRRHFVTRSSKNRLRGLHKSKPVAKGAKVARWKVEQDAAPDGLDGAPALPFADSGTVEERETLTFGQGDILERIYNKSREIRANGNVKDFFPRVVWPKSGQWVGGLDVWRVELQLRRAFLREIAVTLPLAKDEEGPKERVSSDSIEGILASLASWWRYAVGRANGTSAEQGWLSWREPSESPQRTRWPVRPEWEVVRSVPWTDPVRADGVRKRSREACAERLDAMAVGCVTSSSALKGHTSPVEALDAFTEVFLAAMSESAIKPGALRVDGATQSEKGFRSDVTKKARRLNLDHAWAKGGEVA